MMATVYWDREHLILLWMFVHKNSVVMHKVVALNRSRLSSPYQPMEILKIKGLSTIKVS